MRGLEPAPKQKMFRKPPIKKLWINGRVSEDREEWMEERQKIRANSREAWKGERVEVMVDTRGKMMNKQGKRARGLFGDGNAEGHFQ